MIGVQGSEAVPTSAFSVCPPLKAMQGTTFTFKHGRPATGLTAVIPMGLHAVSILTLVCSPGKEGHYELTGPGHRRYRSLCVPVPSLL